MSCSTGGAPHVGRSYQTETPSWEQFTELVQTVNEFRAQIVERDVRHIPWFAKINFKTVKCHQLCCLQGFLDTDGITGVSQTDFESFVQQCGITASWIRISMSQIQWELKVLPSRREPDPYHEHADIAWSYCIPLVDYTTPWDYFQRTNPELPQEDDLMWHSSQVPKAGEELEPFQLFLRSDYIAFMGTDPKLQCSCPRSHFNFTRGWWCCKVCSGNICWNHSEPPCSHSTELHLCRECTSSAPRHRLTDD